MEEKEKELNRIRYIKPYFEGKKVLHIGCVAHDWRESLKEDWIHDYLIKHSKEVIGIDILEKDIKELVKRGYDIRYANAEEFNLKIKFDVIFAGELIEHLENLKGFLESCKSHMNPGSILIISTPNCFGLRYILWHMLGRKFVNSEHKCWFDFWTIRQLLEFHGFEIITEDYLLLDSPKLRGYLNIFLQLIEKIFPRFSPVLIVVARYKL